MNSTPWADTDTDRMRRGEAIMLAISYAEQGLAVFPVGIRWDREKNKTGKRPLNDHGFKQASTSPAEIRRQFEEAVNRLSRNELEVLGVGFYPGDEYVFIDLDITDDADGPAVWAGYEGTHGKVDTLQTTSPSGGAHKMFRTGGIAYSIGHDLGPGIDVRGANGYVVAPGTFTPWGSWEWDGDSPLDGAQPALTPPWLVEKLRPIGGGTGGSDGAGGAASRLDAAARAELDPADRAALEALEKLDGHGAHAVREKAEDGTTVRIIRVTRPGKSSGVSATIGFRGPGSVHNFSSGWKRLPGPAWYDVDQLHAIIAGRNAEDVAKERDLGDGPQPAPDGDVPEYPQLRLLREQMLVGRAVLDIPPPDPIVPDWLDRAMVAELFGPKSNGKTWVALALALAVSTGRPWLGRQVALSGPVLYVAAEGAYTVGERSRGWLKAHQLAELPDTFYLFPNRVNFLELGWRDAVADYATLIGAVLVIIDTLNRSIPGGKENSPEDMGAMFEGCDRVRKASGAAVLVLHHTPHESKDRGRGHGSFEDNCDIVWKVLGDPKRMVLTSEKQKARPDPEPINLRLNVDDPANPWAEPLDATTIGSDVPVDKDDAKRQQAKVDLRRAAMRFRGKRGETVEEWTARAPGVASMYRRAAMRELIDEGFFVESERRGRSVRYLPAGFGGAW